MKKPLNSDLKDFTIHQARVEDIPLILSFIHELAEYEKLAHEVVATEALLHEALFGPNARAEVLLGYYQGEAVCFALFFHNFSTFVGRAGLYLEDIYVQSHMRGRGFGKMLFAYLANLARTRNCGRLEWSVLNWNHRAINFYRSMGAVAMDGWTVNRLHGDALNELADEYAP